jgi:hypothetical protein
MQTAAQDGVQKLYHYQGVNLDYVRNTLANRRVYFSNTKNFNDPWDCNPYFEPAVEDAESRRKWGERLDAMYRDLPAELRAQLEARWEGNWYDHKELLRQSIDKLSGWVRQLTVERWRIYCLTPHADSVLMWAHYAEKHTRACDVNRSAEFAEPHRFPFQRNDGDLDRRRPQWKRADYFAKRDRSNIYERRHCGMRSRCQRRDLHDSAICSSAAARHQLLHL